MLIIIGNSLGQAAHTHISLSLSCNLEPTKAGTQTGTPRDALAPYPWSPIPYQGGVISTTGNVLSTCAGVVAGGEARPAGAAE